MRFGSRLTLAMALAALVPLGALALVLRTQLGDRLVRERQREVEAAALGVERELHVRHARIGDRLSGLASAAAADNQLRAAFAAEQGEERRYMLGWSEQMMPLAGLSMLQLQDEQGRILSSGHFRQEYDRLESGLIEALALQAGPALVRARSPEGEFIAMARLDSVRIGGRTLYVSGGVHLDEAEVQSLASGGTLRIELVLRGDEAGATPAPAATGRLVREVTLPVVNAGGAHAAALRLSQENDDVAALRRWVDRASLAVAAGAALLALLLAAWLARRSSRPVVELAERAAELDLDRLEADFRSDRDDEVGDLSRTLAAMTSRLRSSVGRLREAERRATQGEMARQVNHDIKNGLVPIRNVLRHLAQVCREEPEALPRIFAERQRTLESSVEYLEGLARQYARLVPPRERDAFLLPPVLEEAAAVARTSENVRVRLVVNEPLPPVACDLVSMRRILENVIVNAVDSMMPAGGELSISASLARARGNVPVVRITIADTGKGMTEEELSRAFEDFFTTKEGGTGLGLSVVRRLVADLEGSLRVDTRPGEGTRVTIDLPAAATPRAEVPPLPSAPVHREGSRR